jgi:hypothetical protein
MLFPRNDTTRSEFFTGAAKLVADSLPQQNEHTDQAAVVGWVLFEDTPTLMSYAHLIEQGNEALLILSNGTALKVMALWPNGLVRCARAAAD